MKFEAPGFKVAEVGPVAIVVTETEALDQRLEVGTQAEEVTVQGNVETLQTSSATVGTVMTSETIKDLPLTTRNYTTLLGLSAGANVGVFDAATLGRGTQDIAVNGNSLTQNNFQMDGVSINVFSGQGSAVDSGGNGGIGIANPDAIQEFKIQTSLYDAGYGRNPGANVNVAATGTLAGFVVPSNFNFAANPTPPVGGVFQSDHKYLTESSPAIDNFAPRVGFAWQPLASNRLVVRSGFGYFYDRISVNNYANAAITG